MIPNVNLDLVKFAMLQNLTVRGMIDSMLDLARKLMRSIVFSRPRTLQLNRILRSLLQ